MSSASGGAAFPRTPLPPRLCNLDRLLHAMAARGIDGVVVTQPLNVFYLSSFNGIAHKADEPRPYAVVIARHAPDHPVMVAADYYLSTFLTQPSWIEDIRPYRAVMLPIDRPPARADIDRFIPGRGAGVAWVERARETYAFDMGTALRGALADLGLSKGRVAFDDMAVGFRLRLDGVEIADGYDPLMFARAVKTEAEHALLVRATEMNEAAIRRTMASWQKGMTWRDLNHAYCRAVTDLGGFVHDPGGMVWGHPRGADPALTLQTGLELAQSHQLFRIDLLLQAAQDTCALSVAICDRINHDLSVDLTNIDFPAWRARPGPDHPRPGLKTGNIPTELLARTTDAVALPPAARPRRAQVGAAGSSSSAAARTSSTRSHQTKSRPWRAPSGISS